MAVGWSFGGLLALQIAYNLARDGDITVIGLVLVDAVYPKATVSDPGNLQDADVPEVDATNTALQLKVQQATRHARQMIREWNPPLWQTETPTDQSSRDSVPAEEFTGTPPGDVPHSSTPLVKQRSFPASPPPAILLKASEYVPSQDGSNEGKLAVVDVCRQMKRLGWEQYQHNFIRVVLDIKGHHFNIFAEDKVSLGHGKLPANVVQRKQLIRKSKGSATDD